MKILFLAVVIFLLLPFHAFCQQKEDSTHISTNEYMLHQSHEQLAIAFESSDRDEWQKPEKVIQYLGDIKNKTVVDLGSGSGYFTFRFVNAGAKVIAADIDTRFLNMISEKQETLSIGKNRLQTIQISENKLNIEPGTADIVLLVNVYHHISSRVSYFSTVNTTLKKNGKIVIIDFYKKDLPVGPPLNHKISMEEVLNELKEAGYNQIDTNTDLLEYQYIITAHKF